MLNLSVCAKPGPEKLQSSRQGQKRRTYKQRALFGLWQLDESIKREPFAHIWELQDLCGILRIDAKGELLALIEGRTIQSSIKKFSQQPLVKANCVRSLNSRNEREDMTINQFKQLIAVMNCVQLGSVPRELSRVVYG
jgi:hypothetical protein